MGKTVIRESLFPEIVAMYNHDGKSATYEMIRSRYGLRQPRALMRRIEETGNFIFNPDTDTYAPVEGKEFPAYESKTDTDFSASDSLFMDLDELCKPVLPASPKTAQNPTDDRPAAMDKLVRELISDRLLILSKYVRLDGSSRTIYIDHTSLKEDGYQIVSH